MKFKTVKDMQQAIDEYFDWCDNRTKRVWNDKKAEELLVADPAPYTMSGLARRLGLSRQGLLDYKDRPAFEKIISAARERIHEDVETRLMEKQATGAIFNLKNNFGWKDENKTDITSGGKPLVGFDLYGKGLDKETDKSTT